MSKPMLDGKLMFPTQFLASEEFNDKDVTLKIKAVQIENLRMVDGGAEDKPILTFEKTDKKLVLNKTNATTIADLYGNKAESWAGQSITLFPTTCQAYGKQVNCIRIRAGKPKKKAVADAAPEPVPVNTESEGVTTQAASGPVTSGNLKLVQDILAKDVISRDDCNKVGMLTGEDGDEKVQDVVLIAELLG